MIHAIDTELYLHGCNLFCDKNFKNLNRGSVVIKSEKCASDSKAILRWESKQLRETLQQTMERNWRQFRRSDTFKVS